MSNNPQIPGADLPLATPGATDTVLGVDESSKGLRRFRRDSFPLSAADQARLQALEAGQSSDMLGFTTKAAMDASLAHPANTLAVVTNDPTATNNGTYIKLGASGAGSWQIAADRLTGVQQGLAELDARFHDDDAVIFAVADEDGFTALEVTASRIKTQNIEFSVAGIVMGEDELETSTEYALAIVDDAGFIGFAVGLDGELMSPGVSSAQTFIASDINSLNATALASSWNVASQFNAEVARPVWDYNHFIMYGQSLSTGQEGWPALSKTAKYGNLMLGDSTRPVSGSAAEWSSVGGADTFKPMVATVRSEADGSIMSDAAVAALAAGAQNMGECPLVGMVNFAKHQHNQRWQLANDATRAFIGTNCGVGGKTIEQLSKGASPELYLRLTQAATKAKAAATAAAKSYGVVAVAFLQGEYNYVATYGGSTNKATYKSNLAALYDSVQADVVAAIAAQSSPPLFITYQTGASYTQDTDALSIGMAQWELAEERRNWVLACPVYPYTDKGGHMDSNGYRWIGAQFAKVWHRVVELGQDWKPLSPIKAVQRGREILVNFHVPVAPLVFDTPYVQTTATNYVFKGFEVLDAGGNVALVSVTIVADCVVRILLAEDTVGAVQIRYAGKTAYNGNGNLRDSDPTVSMDNYEYTAGTGQYASANIPALVGRPYPLHNWCIAFQIPVSAG